MIKKKIRNRLIVLLIGMISCIIISNIDRNLNGKPIQENNTSSKIIIMKNN
ncbi:MAG: hypothetical protein KID00_13520 [Clostridium argentinense]|uniref:hypothetical protein n=1 Tax=uncultured Clostridium sp. TaxID=59620 RepID=UPI001DA50A18|nr:hypothetical protein [uncultured Clostridium sp.]MBS5824844.1 hypothetical protein [Clostridium argentinense]MDU1348850.1 hypothetical protein [Clostridium argentinense]